MSLIGMQRLQKWNLLNTWFRRKTVSAISLRVGLQKPRRHWNYIGMLSMADFQCVQIPALRKGNEIHCKQEDHSEDSHDEQCCRADHPKHLHPL